MTHDDDRALDARVAAARPARSPLIPPMTALAPIPAAPPVPTSVPISTARPRSELACSTPDLYSRADAPTNLA